MDGASWYSYRPADGLLDMDSVLLLEISGIDRCDGEGGLARRVRQKIEQVRPGDAGHNAMAGVVAFNMLRVVFRSVE